MTGWRLALAAALAIGVAVLMWAMFGLPTWLRADAAKQKATATVVTGEAAKAGDARIITERTHDTERIIERQTITNERTIRAAPGATDPVAAAVDLAGRHALCLRAAYRDHPACHKLPGADPAQLVDPDTAIAIPNG